MMISRSLGSTPAEVKIPLIRATIPGYISCAPANIRKTWSGAPWESSLIVSGERSASLGKGTATFHGRYCGTLGVGCGCVMSILFFSLTCASRLSHISSHHGGTCYDLCVIRVVYHESTRSTPYNTG